MQKQPLRYSFKYAFQGIGQFFLKDRNGKIHLFSSLMVILAGIYFQVSPAEWISLLLCFGLVIGFEMINHSIEKLADALHPGQSPFIKIVKDVAAAAVLWAAILSCITGLIIFLPKLYLLWQS
ncbi:MAG: hypothetical protein RLZZ28_2202 [Bacteroidota bacterium]